MVVQETEWGVVVAGDNREKDVDEKNKVERKTCTMKRLQGSW